MLDGEGALGFDQAVTSRGAGAAQQQQVRGTVHSRVVGAAHPSGLAVMHRIRGYGGDLAVVVDQRHRDAAQLTRPACTGHHDQADHGAGAR